jgi:hypothetical protein
MLPLSGDTRLHTGFSMDADAFVCRLRPRDADRFARGEQVMASSRQPAKLSLPLDMLVVAGHTDGMRLFQLNLKGTPEVVADPQGRRWTEMVHSGKGADTVMEIIVGFGKGTITKAIMLLPGTKAYQSYLPCRITGKSSR